jgi:hypothetical protein
MINHGQHGIITHDNFFLQHNHSTMVLYILERPPSWSTSRIRPSWPRSKVELRLLLPCLMSTLLVCLAVHSNDSNPMLTLPYYQESLTPMYK